MKKCSLFNTPPTRPRAEEKGKEKDKKREGEGAVEGSKKIPGAPPQTPAGGLRPPRPPASAGFTRHRPFLDTKFYLLFPTLRLNSACLRHAPCCPRKLELRNSLASRRSFCACFRLPPHACCSIWRRVLLPIPVVNNSSNDYHLIDKDKAKGYQHDAIVDA